MQAIKAIEAALDRGGECNPFDEHTRKITLAALQVFENEDFDLTAEEETALCRVAVDLLFLQKEKKSIQFPFLEGPLMRVMEEQFSDKNIMQMNISGAISDVSLAVRLLTGTPVVRLFQKARAATYQIEDYMVDRLFHKSNKYHLQERLLEVWNTSSFRDLSFKQRLQIFRGISYSSEELNYQWLFRLGRTSWRFCQHTSAEFFLVIKKQMNQATIALLYDYVLATGIKEDIHTLQEIASKIKKDKTSFAQVAQVLYPDVTFKEGDDKAIQALWTLDRIDAGARENVEGGHRRDLINLGLREERGAYLAMVANLIRGMSDAQVNCIITALNAFPLDKRINAGALLEGYLFPNLTIAKIRDFFAGRNSLGGCGLG
jgi:hypothetical protein